MGRKTWKFKSLDLARPLSLHKRGVRAPGPLIGERPTDVALQYQENARQSAIQRTERTAVASVTPSGPTADKCMMPAVSQPCFGIKLLGECIVSEVPATKELQHFLIALPSQDRPFDARSSKIIHVISMMAVKAPEANLKSGMKVREL